MSTTELQVQATDAQELIHLLPSPFTNTQPAPELLTQGAEALVYKTHFLTPAQPAILKFRPSKAYRHPTLDARLTKQRVLAEARVLVKLSAPDVRDAGVHVPGVLALEWDVARKVKNTGAEVERYRKEAQGAVSGAWILMEFVEGSSVKDLLRGVDGYVKGRAGSGNAVNAEEMVVIEQEVKGLLRRIGRAVGALHSKGGVVHGDLTSSNVMVRPYRKDHGLVNGDGDAHGEAEEDRCPNLSGDVVLIDFGLATQSTQDEDRAVDLYVLERAFGSTHPKQEGWFDAEVLKHQDGYKGSFKGSNVVVKRLEEVRMRGRKRSMIG
ncbi:serine/threonine-protein kinase bud32 [Neophaeococcomyces mojaviensis]|uniref:Serine/threonine-protein kinase bud32 n=1 Tax=Neophaeococcomyces mojaviensis TaxID=3383035 RepID=A0ACC3ACW2_9EURO|nr:serine/threonine-protein kinase bud32 [Knufia sp. JES_112]